MKSRSFYSVETEAFRTTFREYSDVLDFLEVIPLSESVKVIEYLPDSGRYYGFILPPILTETRIETFEGSY